MVFEELITAAPELENTVNSLIKLLQVIGGIVGIWLILWIINFAYSIRRTLLIKKMIKKFEELEVKIDKLSRKS